VVDQGGANALGPLAPGEAIAVRRAAALEVALPELDAPGGREAVRGGTVLGLVGGVEREAEAGVVEARGPDRLAGARLPPPGGRPVDRLVGLVALVVELVLGVVARTEEGGAGPAGDF
jgi:hypothetical protein